MSINFANKLHSFRPSFITLIFYITQSMSDLLKRRKKLTEPEVRYYLVQLISSLKYLHSNLVIHRDLKLGNLFLDSQMRIKVGDFGLATKIADVNERRKTFCGTPNYIGKIFTKLVSNCFHNCIFAASILLISSVRQSTV